jgi:hypothetical protein
MSGEIKNNPGSRRKFVLWGSVLLTGISLLSVGIFKRRKQETVKLLTQDGRLVEVDKRMLTGKKKKIASSELQQWIKRN